MAEKKGEIAEKEGQETPQPSQKTDWVGLGLAIAIALLLFGFAVYVGVTIQDQVQTLAETIGNLPSAEDIGEAVAEAVSSVIAAEEPSPPTLKPAAVVASATKSNESPTFFDGDNCPPEEFPDGCSLDIGVNDNQIGLVFGWHLRWPLGGLDVGGGGCDLVLLRPGWYENLWLLDARFEVYDLPVSDQEGWIKVLATQRADEQTAHYVCPKKDFVDIPQWDSSLESPPVATPITEPTATPTTVARERRPTGQEQTLRFEVGESVYGWRIELDTGEVCDGGECYLPSAPSAGTVTSGVINPWPAEVEGVTPWEP